MKNQVCLDLSRETPIIFFLLKNISARQNISYVKISPPREYVSIDAKKICKTIFFLFTLADFSARLIVMKIYLMLKNCGSYGNELTDSATIRSDIFLACL